MPTIKPVLRKQKKNPRGEAPVYLRIADRDKNRFVALGVRVKPADWNSRKGEVRRGHDDEEALNSLIAAEVAKARRALYRLRADGEWVSAERLKKVLGESESHHAAGPLGERQEEASGPDFLTFMAELTQDHRDHGRPWTVAKYNVVKNKLIEMHPDQLRFEDVTPAFLRRFETFLAREKGNKINTIATNLNVVRRVIRRAISEGHLAPEKNPFLHHQVRQEPTERTRLTLAEIKKIERLKLDEGSFLSLTRDVFLFAFYSAGVRFSDIALLRWRSVQDGRLHYRTRKNRKEVSVKLVPQAAAILEQYKPTADNPDTEQLVFPLVSSYDLSTPALIRKAVRSRTTSINLALKDLAKLAKIEKNISTHVARHSFAELARQKGMSIYDISKALRHSNLKMTERYLAGFDAHGLDASLEKLFSHQTETSHE